MAIALSKKLYEAANALSKCTSTEQKPNNHDTHKKPDVFGGQVNKNVKNAKICPTPHNWVDSHNPKYTWAYSSMAAKVKVPRESTITKDESDHHSEHKESEQD